MRNTIIMTGGGTAGHVMVNTVLIPRLIALGWEVVYIGSHQGIEKEMIEAIEGVTYYGISTGKLRRYLSLENVKDVFKVLKGIFAAYAVMGKIKPTVIFSCGGYVAVPVIIAGWLRRIPNMIRETDYTVGLANKICMPLADQVCVTFPDTLKDELSNVKRVACGPIIREELLRGSRARGIALANFSGEKPVLLVQGGSQGASKINEVIREALDVLVSEFDIIHLCGRGNKEEYLEREGYRQYEYIQEEMAHFYEASDVVVTRAGSNAVFEGMVLGKPMVLLPISRRVSRGDQILNARYVERQGMGRVILEEELTAERLILQIQRLYQNRRKHRDNRHRGDNEGAITRQIGIISQYFRH